MASAPIGVVTLGVPQSMASVSLPLIPAPKRSGARQIRALPITSRASSAQFMMWKPSPGLCNAVALGGV
ncbi:hypothetical protein D3C72_1663340 [compost metagenome]